MVDKQETLQLLSRHGPEIRERFGVKRLALFGSVARGDAGEESDIDVLVGFEESSTFDGYFGLKFYLEDLLGREVDLVTETGLRPVFRPYVEEEAIEIS